MYFIVQLLNCFKHYINFALKASLKKIQQMEDK